jgi:hypothetical protein
MHWRPLDELHRQVINNKKLLKKIFWATFLKKCHSWYILIYCLPKTRVFSLFGKSVHFSKSSVSCKHVRTKSQTKKELTNKSACLVVKRLPQLPGRKNCLGNKRSVCCFPLSCQPLSLLKFFQHCLKIFCKFSISNFFAGLKLDGRNILKKQNYKKKNKAKSKKVEFKKHFVQLLAPSKCASRYWFNLHNSALIHHLFLLSWEPPQGSHLDPPLESKVVNPRLHRTDHTEVSLHAIG